MLTSKKVLTINKCSVRFFKMIQSMPLKLTYINSYNKLNKLVLFLDINDSVFSSSRCLKGE
jgi:hypothetical protein